MFVTFLLIVKNLFERNEEEYDTKYFALCKSYAKNKWKRREIMIFPHNS